MPIWFPLVQELHQQLQALGQILQDEFALLKQAKAQELENNAQRKSEQLDHIAKTTQEIYRQSQLQPQKGLPLGQLLAQNFPDLQAKQIETLHQLDQLIASNQQQNQINGATIRVLAHQNQLILNILRGKSGLDGTYDAKGKSATEQDHHNKSLAEA